MVFALIFSLMAGFVALIAVAAVKARNEAGVTTASGVASATVSGGSGARTNAHPNLSAQLAAALRAEIGTDSGTLAVGVFNTATDRMAVYNPSLRCPAAGLSSADILAALMLQHQHSGMPVAAHDTRLAAEMIDTSGIAATTALWRQLGGAAGIQAANRALKLTHTSVATAGRLGLTSTTVSDQLQLLADLTSASSPLDAASRAYVVSLMERAPAGQRWGIPAAASLGTRYAVRSGWLPDPRLLIVDSMGIVRRNGQELLIVVLSKDNSTKAAGIKRAEAAAVTAAEVVTAGSS